MPYERDSTAYLLTGTAGALSIPDLTFYSYVGEEEGEWRRPLSRKYVQMGFGDSYSRQLAHFVDVARGLTEPKVTVADAARTLALIEAAQDAAITGKAIDVAY
jgi:predicted dehydrogenase